MKVPLQRSAPYLHCARAPQVAAEHAKDKAEKKETKKMEGIETLLFDQAKRAVKRNDESKMWADAGARFSLCSV